MPYLILDLDLTAIVHEEAREGAIDEFHYVPYETFPASLLFGSYQTNVHLINPNELAVLIEIAYSQYDGVIILTSGMWDASMRGVLAENLNLSEETKTKLKNCLYHSPLTDEPYFDSPLLNIQSLNKKERLEKIVEHNPMLAAKHFVLLDDSDIHIDSFKEIDHVIAVLATTHLPDKNFYQQSIEALKKVAENEKSLHLSAVNPLLVQPPILQRQTSLLFKRKSVVDHAIEGPQAKRMKMSLSCKEELPRLF